MSDVCGSVILHTILRNLRSLLSYEIYSATRSTLLRNLCAVFKLSYCTLRGVHFVYFPVVNTRGRSHSPPATSIGDESGIVFVVRLVVDIVVVVHRLLRQSSRFS